MRWQETSARSARKSRVSLGVLLLSGFGLAAPACGSDDRPGTAHPNGGSSSGSGGTSAAGGVTSAKGGNAGGSARGGATGVGNAGGAAGADPGSFGGTPGAGADSGGAASGGVTATSGGTPSSGGTSSVGGNGGSAGVECTTMAAACAYGDGSCCRDAACYAPSGSADSFCATRCVENSDCDGSQPGCCAPLAENGARVCVPSELCQ